MPPKLPQELVDQAIDHLWNDVQTLAACAIACHAFLPSARTHLFRDQRVVGSKGCARFAAFLEDSPDLIRYIRTLSIFEPTSTAYPSKQNWTNRIPVLVHKLERLVTLELVGLRYVSFHVPEASSAFSRLTNIVASDVYFSSFLDVHILLAAARNAKSVCFYRMGWDNPPLLSDCRPDPVPLHMGRLIVDSWTASDFLQRWLLPCADLGDVTIHTLMIRWRERDSFNLLNALFRVCGPSLRHLYVDLPGSIAGSQEALTLFHNTNLRTLEMDGLVLPGNVALVSMLSQLRSTRLEKLSLSMLILNKDALSSFEWDQLDTFLARPQYVDVAVTINVNRALHPLNDPDTIESAIMGHLPGMVQRSKLAIKCSF